MSESRLNRNLHFRAFGLRKAEREGPRSGPSLPKGGSNVAMTDHRVITEHADRELRPGIEKAQAEPARRVEPAIYKSLALNALLQQLDPGHKYSILDLGKACGENINFWSQTPARICLPDFYPSLQAERASISDPDEGPSGESLFRELLSCASGCRFDIILGWDLFNYLETVLLEDLIRVLREFCHQGTLVFVLISTLQQIPAEPTHFKILDRERLVYENSSPVMKPCPRYQPRDVKMMMAGFDVLVSFLLRHGMQEYLFAYHG